MHMYIYIYMYSVYIYCLSLSFCWFKCVYVCVLCSLLTNIDDKCLS